ncbi:uncharacterized protein LOC133892976 [Phragmites australis]|uniref:uncharacterized protein LOC133892976 n=1 Tax=Phragmites australis TaxID=29695 RepID=UPI002D7969EA|nr:uncharacterized protein LOC133892976 [Phragmites australis]
MRSYCPEVSTDESLRCLEASKAELDAAVRMASALHQLHGVHTPPPPPPQLSRGARRAVDHVKNSFMEHQAYVVAMIAELALQKHTTQTGQDSRACPSLHLRQTPVRERPLHDPPRQLLGELKQKATQFAGEAPSLFFAEVNALTRGASDVTLCCPAPPSHGPGGCSACEFGGKRLVHPTGEEFYGRVGFTDGEDPAMVDRFKKHPDSELVFSCQIVTVCSSSCGGVNSIVKYNSPATSYFCSCHFWSFNRERKAGDNLAATALESAALALGSNATKKIDKERAGVVEGAGVVKEFSAGVETLVTKGPMEISPLSIPLAISNAGSALVSIDAGIGFLGPNYSISTACATSNHCFHSAADQIRLGRADVMVAGGAEAAIMDINLHGSQVNYINVHATSSLAGDLAEANALKQVFKDTYRIKMNATKFMAGHCLGAAVGLEAIVTIKAITTGWVHPTINQFNADPAVDQFDTVRNVKQQHKVHVGISNSFGFGGHNSVVVFAPLSIAHSVRN